MNRFWWLLCSLPLSAHMVSMSTGELKVAGNRAHYELFMPMYEVAHVHDPAKTLLQHIRFKGAGAWGKASNESCHQGLILVLGIQAGRRARRNPRKCSAPHRQ